MTAPLPVVHRVNTIRALAAVPTIWGVEIDLRDDGRRVVVQHEPFRGGERLDDYLRQFRHRLLILNIKSEGIEEAVLRAVRRHRIRRYFLLDVTIPRLVALSRRGVPHLAARVSEFEAPEACLALGRRVEWLWIDWFTRWPLTPAMTRRLAARFRLCLCSPEVEGHPVSTIAAARRIVRRLPVEAVCTDAPDRWSGLPC